MRSTFRIIVTALAALLLLPATVGAQAIIEPEPPRPCPDCWWPAGAVAQLDGIEADMSVINGQGLVGRVLKVTASTSTVVLIVEASSAVGGSILFFPVGSTGILVLLVFLVFLDLKLKIRFLGTFERQNVNG